MHAHTMVSLYYQLIILYADSNSEVMSVKERKKILAEQYPNVFQF